MPFCQMTTDTTLRQIQTFTFRVIPAVKNRAFQVKVKQILPEADFHLL